MTRGAPPEVVSRYLDALLDRRSKSPRPPVRLTFSRGREETGRRGDDLSELRRVPGPAAELLKQTTLSEASWLTRNLTTE